MKREKFSESNTSIHRVMIKGCAAELSTTAFKHGYCKSAYVVYLPESGDFEIIIKSADRTIKEIVQDDQEWEFFANLLGD